MGKSYPERLDGWLRSIPVKADQLAALVVGDSPAIINLGAGAAHIRRAEAALPVVQAIGQVLARGWHLGWERIPRAFNQDADQRARRAAGLPSPRPRPPRQ